MGKFYAKYKKRHRIKRGRFFLRNKFFWVSFAFLSIFGGIFYFLIFSSFFQIKEIQISGNRKITEEILKSFIRKKIQNKALIFSTQNLFLADSEKIGKDALESFILLDEIKIEKKLPDGLSVSIEEKKPAAVLPLSDKIFLVDKKGVIFEEGTESLPGLAVLSLNVPAEELKLGKKILEEGHLSKIIEMKEKLKSDWRLAVESFGIVSDDKLVVDLKDGWEFYVNLEGDVDWQMTKLAAVLEEKIPPEKRRDLEYIELRFGNFAPYKYR